MGPPKTAPKARGMDEEETRPQPPAASRSAVHPQPTPPSQEDPQPPAEPEPQTWTDFMLTPVAFLNRLMYGDDDDPSNDFDCSDDEEIEGLALYSAGAPVEAQLKQTIRCFEVLKSLFG